MTTGRRGFFAALAAFPVAVFSAVRGAVIPAPPALPTFPARHPYTPEVDSLPFVDHNGWRYRFTDTPEQFYRIWNNAPRWLRDRLCNKDMGGPASAVGYRSMWLCKREVMVIDRYRNPGLFIVSLTNPEIYTALAIAGLSKGGVWNRTKR